MEGPPLGPGREDITGPTRWPPGAERRLVPAKSNVKPQTTHARRKDPWQSSGGTSTITLKGTIDTIDLVGTSITVEYVTLPQMRVLHCSGTRHIPFLQISEWPQHRLFHQYLTQTARAAGHTLPGSQDMKAAYLLKSRFASRSSI